MPYIQIGKLIDKWLNEQDFRKQLRTNPEEAVKKSGINLTEEELEAFKKIDWNQSDQELQSLISKAV